MRKFLAYAKARIRERSTIAAISAVIPTAVQLESPWCWLVIIAAIAVALIQTSPADESPKGSSQ